VKTNSEAALSPKYIEFPPGIFTGGDVLAEILQAVADAIISH
jgi:hypothetical protein